MYVSLINYVFFSNPIVGTVRLLLGEVAEVGSFAVRSVGQEVNVNHVWLFAAVVTK